MWGVLVFCFLQTVENWLLYNYLCTHLFHVLSQPRRGEKALLTLFQVSDSQQSECGTSQRERVDRTELLSLSATLALDCSSYPSHSTTDTPLRVSSANSWSLSASARPSHEALVPDRGGHRYPGMNPAVNTQSDSLFGSSLQSK